MEGGCCWIYQPGGEEGKARRLIDGVAEGGGVDVAALREKQFNPHGIVGVLGTTASQRDEYADTQKPWLGAVILVRQTRKRLQAPRNERGAGNLIPIQTVPYLDRLAINNVEASS